MSFARRVFVFVAVVSGLIVGVVGFRFVDKANLMETLEEVPAACRTLEAPPGPEDIVVDRERRMAFVSATDRRLPRSGGEVSMRRRGGIYRIDLDAKDEDWRFVPVTPTESQDFQPHGIGLFVDEDGARSLFVVNHPSEGPDEVVLFDVDASGSLRHRRTVTDASMVDLNDVQPVGRDAFYVTNDHATDLSVVVQDVLLLDRANLVYFDGVRARVVAEGLTYANGVNVSPDGRSVYVAETTDGALRVYDRDPASGSLDLAATIDLETGVDNIDVLENGDLLIGAHPRLLAFSAHAADPAKLSPSQVLRVFRDGEDDWSFETLYLDRGEELSGSAVAAGYRDKMLLGPVFEARILVCDRALRG